MAIQKKSMYKQNLEKLAQKANSNAVEPAKEEKEEIKEEKLQEDNSKKEDSKVQEEKLQTDESLAEKNEDKDKTAIDETKEDKKEIPLEIAERLKEIEEYIKGKELVATNQNKPVKLISPQEQINCLIEEIYKEKEKELNLDDDLFGDQDESEDSKLRFIDKKPTFSQPARPQIHKIFDILADNSKRLTKYEIFERVVIAGVKQYLNKKA